MSQHDGVYTGLSRTDLNGAQTPAFAVHIESRLQIPTSMLLHPRRVWPVVHPGSPAVRIGQAEAMSVLRGSAGDYSPDFLQTLCESSEDALPSNSRIRDDKRRVVVANLELCLDFLHVYLNYCYS